MNVAFRVTRVARIVRHHADRRAGPVQLVQQLHHRLAALRIEVTGGLVGEQHDRFAGDGARHGDALLLAAGKLAGEVLGAVRHPDALERLADALAPLGRGHAPVGERQLDVLEDRQVADQIEALENEPDLAVAHAGAIAGRKVGNGLAVQPVLAARGRVEQPENRQQRGLAASRWAADRHVFALGDLEIDVGERVRFDFVCQEDLGDRFQLDNVGCHLNLSVTAMQV